MANEATFAEHLLTIRPREQDVYFIRAGRDGPVKIGIAEDPRARLHQLQTGQHETLVLLGVCPGGAQQEARLHLRYAAQRVRGEWFRATPEMLTEVTRPEDPEALYATIAEMIGGSRADVVDLRLDQALERAIHPRPSLGAGNAVANFWSVPE